MRQVTMAQAAQFNSMKRSLEWEVIRLRREIALLEVEWVILGNILAANAALHPDQKASDPITGGNADG